MPAGLVTNVQMEGIDVHHGREWILSIQMKWTTCPEGQLTVPQSCLAVLLPADILKPKNKRLLEKRWAKWAHWSRISAVRV
jgi:hypothetical protein